MLGKHIIGYLPSLAIPALAAFASIFCYTRLLSTQQFGHYTLALNSMTLLNAIFFYWLQVSLPRLMPQANREGRAQYLRATTYIAYLASSIVLLFFATLFISVWELGDMLEVAILAVPLVLARSLLNMNQAFHRSALDFKRYNIIECGQAILGLSFGLALVWLFGLKNLGATGGLIIGMCCMVLVDIRSLMRTSLRDFDITALRDISAFGLPLVGIFALSFITSTSDRFLIEHLRGASEVGIYGAGYGLMDRIAQILFMVVATPSFPLTIYKLEHEGVEAARKQTYVNGVAMLALAMPACAGLLLCNRELAEILIGERFREGAILIMPWIAVSSMLAGFATHYFDHAFHLAKKPHLLVFTQGPAALLNFLLNIYLIPEMGFIGAAYASFASYLLLLILSAGIGRLVFKISFPFLPFLQISVVTLAMAAALFALPAAYGLTGLAMKVVIGGSVYGAGLLLLNVMDARGKLIKIFRKAKAGTA